MNLYKISQIVILILAGISIGVLLFSGMHFVPLLIINSRSIEEVAIKLKQWIDGLNLSQTVLVKVSSL